MDTTFLLIFAVVVSCFFLSYIWYALLNKNPAFADEQKFYNNPVVPFITTSTIGFVVLYWFLPPQYDQLFDISLINIGLIFGGSLLTFLGFCRSQIMGIILLTVSALILTIFLPQGFLLFNGALPLILDRLLTLAIFCSFVFCYQYLNGLDGLLPTQTSFPLIGAIILSFIGALPILFGGMSGILLGVTLSFAIYNWYPSQLRLNTAGCQALAFFITGFYLLCAQEGCATPILIFSISYIIDTGLALVKKLSLKDQYQNIQANTITYQTNISGLEPGLICENIAKLNCILLIFGSFQAYSPNNYSLLVLGSVLSLWFLHHLLNWQTPEQSFSEINKEVFNDLKNNLNSIKRPTDKDE